MLNYQRVSHDFGGWLPLKNRLQPPGEFSYGVHLVHLHCADSVLRLLRLGSDSVSTEAGWTHGNHVG